MTRRKGEEERVCVYVCVEGKEEFYFDFMYAGRRLYIAVEARESAISISFDKNKHCRGTRRTALSVCLLTCLPP